MAQLGYTVDKDDQFNGANTDPLPAGEYRVMITDSDVVVPKSGKGRMVKLTYECIDPDYQGRKVFDNIVVEHPSADAERIGKQKLNTIGSIVGVKVIKDTAQLHGKPLGLLLGVKTTAEFGTQNIIKKYLDLNEDEADESADEDTPKKPSFIRK